MKFAAFLIPLCLVAQSGLDTVWAVRGANAFHAALAPGIGFSFTYDGTKVGPALPGSGWQVSSSGTDTIFRHPSGLRVTRAARQFPASDAVEYTVRFANEGAAPLPVLSGVNAVDVVFAGDIVNGASAVTSGGGAADPVYPPRDFSVERTYFGPLMPVGGQVNITTAEGNSSRTNLPFLFLENQGSRAGVFASIGWTGNWKASVQAHFGRRTLALQGGMLDLSVRLNPGEEISGPSILLGCYGGQFADGSNALRRLVRDRYAPTVAGKRLQAPVLYTTWFDVGAELDEILFKRLADRAAGLGMEIFLLDAGWYKGTPKRLYTDMQGTWDAISGSLGNWELGEDRERFPSGLKALSDYVRSKGMQFGLWFEPERTGPESLLAKQHPDWVLFVPKRKWGLVDFGKPGVPEYFCKILDRYITELKLRYIRWDQNNNLLPYWEAHDAPERRGILQIRHLEGIHRVEDWVREHHPEVIFESCAGGGQRIDLPTLSRRHTMWVSDQTMDPLIVRFHLEGLNLFIPGNGQMVGFSPPVSTYQQPGFAFPDVALQSYFGGAFGVAGRLYEWPDKLSAQVRRHVDAFKKVRDFLPDDYYLLTPQTRRLEDWSGWQFHDREAGAGFVQAFRNHSAEGSKKLVLHGLDAKAKYSFSDPYGGPGFEAAGAKLVSDGLAFELPEMASRVWLYRRAGR